MHLNHIFTFFESLLDLWVSTKVSFLTFVGMKVISGGEGDLTGDVDGSY